MMLPFTRQRSTILLLGLLMMLIGFGGSWGVSYGQTAGPTPTQQPAPTALSNGAEGEDRPTAVAGAADDATLAGDASAGEQALIPNSGAEAATPVYWSLVALGAVLVVCGAALYMRARSEH